MSCAPILVTGAPRSGTTWVGEMLAKAPGVGYVHEPFNPLTDPGIAGRPFSRFLAYVTEENDGPPAEALSRALRFSYNWRRQVPTLRTPRDVARTSRDGLRFRRLRTGGARPLVKDPIAVFSAPWMAQRFGMEVVVTIRQPAAFVASFKRLRWHHDFASMLDDRRLIGDRLAAYEPEIRALAQQPGDLVTEAVLLWRVIYGTVAQYRTEHPEWQYVRQEDLARDPVTQFEKLYAALGLDFDDRIRAAVEAHSSALNPDRLAKAHGTRLDSRASLEGWRKVLTDDEVEQVREGARDVASSFYAEGEW